VTAGGINIDRTAPTVRVRGVKAGTVYAAKAPQGRCAASDQGSGVASCTLVRKVRGKRVTYTAVATDRAGNTTRVRVRASVAPCTVTGAPYRSGVFVVRGGHSVRLTVVSKVRPRYLAAVPSSRRPAVPGRWLKRSGKAGGVPRWTITVRFTRAQATTHRGRWSVGVLTGRTRQVVKVRVR